LGLPACFAARLSFERPRLLRIPPPPLLASLLLLLLLPPSGLICDVLTLTARPLATSLSAIHVLG